MKKKLFFFLLFFLLHTPLFSQLIVEKDKDFIVSSPNIPTSLAITRKIGPIKIKEKNFQIYTEKGIVKTIIRENIVYLYSTSITNEGDIFVIIKKDKEEITNFFRIIISTEDSDKDGFPDLVELGNNKSFREWFCVIAESQFYYPSDIWYDIHKDCGGLVEFAYREALKRHDKRWASKYKFLSDFSIPDERNYYYPSVPIIGEKIFRIKEGEFKKESIDRDFSVTASGSVIRNYCMEFVSKDIKNLQKGDILFFFKSDNLKMPSHAMIYIGPENPEKEEGFLIYHTGPSQKTKGFIKKVKLRDLLKHPDPSWRPVPENTDFLGIYCWKILR